MSRAPLLAAFAVIVTAALHHCDRTASGYIAAQMLDPMFALRRTTPKWFVWETRTRYFATWFARALEASFARTRDAVA